MSNVVTLDFSKPVVFDKFLEKVKEAYLEGGFSENDAAYLLPLLEEKLRSILEADLPVLKFEYAAVDKISEEDRAGIAEEHTRVLTILVERYGEMITLAALAAAELAAVVLNDCSPVAE